jgi:hypothetical protein
MTTSVPPRDGGGELPGQESIWLPVDSPASRSAKPHATGGGRGTRGGDGRGSVTSSTLFGLHGSSWRTWQDFSAMEKRLELSSPTYPSAGSMRNGRWSPRARWVPHKCGVACSLWPTPRARDFRGIWVSSAHQGGQDLATAVGGVPHPEFVEWLMGFPTGWTESVLWGTPLFPV